MKYERTVKMNFPRSLSEGSLKEKHRPTFMIKLDLSEEELESLLVASLRIKIAGWLRKTNDEFVASLNERVFTLSELEAECKSASISDEEILKLQERLEALLKLRKR